MSKIYIAGPMTGLPGYNHPAFNEAAKRLRAAGWEVLNPAETDGGSTDKARYFYIRRAMKLLVRADCVVLLDGWLSSHGANLERMVAMDMSCPIYYGLSAALAMLPNWKQSRV